MRQLLLPFLVLLSTLSAAQEWVWSNPLPQGNDLKSVRFINIDTGFAVGIYGTVIKTTDGGESWSVTFHDSHASLNCVDFLDEKLGLAAGTGGLVLRTVDMGIHWEAVSIASSPVIEAIQVVTDSLVYLVGRYGWNYSELYRSTDAGLTWELKATINGYSGDLFAIGTDTVFALGEYGIFRSLDGGSSWNDSVYDGGHSMQTLHFTNSHHGMATGGSYGYDFDTPCILVTEDGGETWTYSMVAGPPVVYNTACFGSDLVGYAVGKNDKYRIIRTVDGGHYWEYVSKSDFNIMEFSFPVEDKVGYCVGYNGSIQKTTDSALTWVSISKQVVDDFTCIYFTAPGKGFVCGNDMIASTENNGDEWQKVPFLVYPGDDLTSIDFSSQTDGFAAGDNCLYVTRDGGSTWSWNLAGTWPKFNGLDIPPDSDWGYMVGRNSRIVKFNLDLSGLYWQFQPISLTNTELFSVHFPVKETGFVAAEGGIILKTRNGGAHWEQTHCGVQVNLYSIFFIDELTGWTVGENGTILRTNDGGNTWSQQSSGTGQAINMVRFLDTFFGYAVGNAGTILRTTDGGTNWEPEWAPTANDLKSVFIWDSSHVYVCGEKNTILKSGTGDFMAVKDPIHVQTSPRLSITPNPFRQQARVTFELTAASRAEFSIIDLRGIILETVLNEPFSQGRHEFILDQGNLSPGLYLLRLKCDHGTAVQEILVGH